MCDNRLSAAQVSQWREFADDIPWAHYSQDPVWADVEYGAGTSARRPFYFWMEVGGRISVTAVGLKRDLPVPRRSFWEFPKGPLFADSNALDQWLTWITARLGRDAARLRLGPTLPLSDMGDDVETLLEVRGFTRRRTLGGWATLVVDLTKDEGEIRHAFRSATQRSIRKSIRLGLNVSIEDEPEGWTALSALQSDLARVTPVDSVGVSALERYSRLWLRGGEGGTVLVARYRGEPVAGALVLKCRDRAHLPMIPSARDHRQVPASHLLVWEAMRWAKQNGCTLFDFSGYSLVARPGEPLWGINQFKRGFAAEEALEKTVAIHERVQSPWIASSAQLVRDVQARLRRPSSSGRSGE